MKKRSWLIAWMACAVAFTVNAEDASEKAALEQVQANISEALGARNKAELNYQLCVKAYRAFDDNVMKPLEKLRDEYSRAQTLFGNLRRDVDEITQGNLSESQIDSITNRFASLKARLDANQERVLKAKENSTEAAFASAEREFNTARDEFVKFSKASWAATRKGDSMEHYESAKKLHREAFGRYGEVHFDNILPDTTTKLGVFRHWQVDMRDNIVPGMRDKQEKRGDILTELVSYSASAERDMASIRGKLTLPTDWEGDLNDFYKALKEWMKPRTVVVKFMHDFGRKGEFESFGDDIPEHTVDITNPEAVVTLPSYAERGKMQETLAKRWPGWTFTGWRKADESLFRNGSEHLEGDLVLYANREEIPVKVVYLDMAGDVFRSEDLYRYDREDAIVRPEEPPARWGYEFKGWKKKGRDTLYTSWGKTVLAEIPGDTPNSALRLEFEQVWAMVPFTITYEDAENTDVRKITLQDPLPDVPVAEKAHWESIGWASTKGSVNADVKAGSPVTSVLSDPETKATFYAVRRPIPYKVSFLSRTAASPEAEPYGESQTGSIVQKIAKPADPAIAHYIFEGWHVGAADGTLFDFDEPVTAEQTLVAAWRPVAYIVRLFAPDGTESVYDTGKPWNIETPLDAPPRPQTEDAYDFCFWTESVPPSGAVWKLLPDEDAPAAFTFEQPVVKDTVLYSVVRHRQYKVTFKVNNSRVVDVKTVLHGQTVERIPDPTRQDELKIKLRYWQVVGGAQGPYDFDAPVTGDFTLSTIWERDIEHTAPAPEPEKKLPGPEPVQTAPGQGSSRPMPSLEPVL